MRVERQYDCPEEARGLSRARCARSSPTSSPTPSKPRRSTAVLRLRVRCSRSWSDPGVRGIRISVGDNGSGIPPEVRRRLGEAFFTTKGQRGTGLGLWVTRSIVQRYGGEMQLRSSVSPERHGTVFSIFLPTNLRPQKVDLSPQERDPDGDTNAAAPVTFPNRTEGAATGRTTAQDQPNRKMRGA
jgi:hypothetical protein